MSTVGEAFDSALQGLRVRYAARLEDAASELSKLIAFCEIEDITPKM